TTSIRAPPAWPRWPCSTASTTCVSSWASPSTSPRSTRSPPCSTGRCSTPTPSRGLRRQDVHAYTTAGWETFFGAIVGATAALTRLLFVAVSINLDRILEGPQFLTRRAAETLGTLVFVLAVSGLVLVPQPVRALGAEILLVVVPFLILTVPSQVAIFRA